MTEILPASNPDSIRQAKRLLSKGQLVAIPTETVYGLAANAFSEEAVAGIFAVKGRPSNNPLIVHYHSHQNLKKDCLNSFLDTLGHAITQNLSLKFRQVETGLLEILRILKASALQMFQSWVLPTAQQYLELL